MTELHCDWCNQPLIQKPRGTKHRRFCSPYCKRAEQRHRERARKRSTMQLLLTTPWDRQIMALGGDVENQPF